MKSKWQEAQEWEANWHGDCTNSLNEELKQLAYAKRMGLELKPTPKTPYNFDLKGVNVLDIGSGPYSLLLKCQNKGDCVVSDPLMGDFPEWVWGRYDEAGLIFTEISGEDIELVKNPYDEVWMYNVLQHTKSPKKIIENARKVGKIIRIFEWVNTGTNIGHLHNLKAHELDKWLGGAGKVEKINEGGAVGTCYYGIFKGDNYEI